MPGVQCGPHTAYVPGRDSLASWKPIQIYVSANYSMTWAFQVIQWGLVPSPSCWSWSGCAPVQVVQLKCSQVKQLLCEALLCFPLPFFCYWGSTLGPLNSRQVPFFFCTTPRPSWVSPSVFSHGSPLPPAVPHTCLCWRPSCGSQCLLTLSFEVGKSPLQENVPSYSVTQFSVWCSVSIYKLNLFL